MMPRELAGVLIKAQHHCRSDHKTYRGMRLPAIEHEYILIWERRGVVMLAALKDIGEKLKGRASGTWKNIVKLALMELGGTASLQALYDQVSRGAPARIQLNPHWKAKVRQTLQLLPDVQPLEAGSWGFTTS
ncbi:hypothetical protein [Deinococcus roseus]|uniref:Uncharacterized protein n=1 Tax=Deinococcus roseus TaxID=392414 RepID=A0ABQ2D3E5_9DEIO|nr:hypothetical protein [Deinococcus roseus]GGJ44671.1 hypothetical protein GCM10008938_33560 [Deinococcus roseus]